MSKIKVFLSVFLVFVLITVFMFVFTSLPEVLLLKLSYTKISYTKPENYEQILKNVKIFRDLEYPSNYSSNKLDIILPKPFTEKNKVIFWVHGGSFIGGDKKDVEHYLVMLANEGYSIVNINYVTAPSRHYPTPLIQLAQAYQYAKDNALKYNLNFDDVYVGGDSAGAQIAAQFANLLTNKEYFEKVNVAVKNKFDNVVMPEKLSGVILFCGPYNLKELADPQKNSMLLPYKKIAWAYFATKDKDNINIDLASIPDKISSNYPKAFITDGNTRTFENQALQLCNELKNKGVEVYGVFYNTGVKLKHEYQFEMNTPEAMKTFSELLKFLK